MKCFKVLIMIILFQFFFIPYSKCSDWDVNDINAREASMVQKLKEVEAKGSGHHLEGTKNLLAYQTSYDQWIYIKTIKASDTRQHIYLFNTDFRAEHVYKC